MRGSRALMLTAALAVGQATTLARSADLGRVAVLRPDGTVGPLRGLGDPAASRRAGVREGRCLRKDYLVVLTKSRTLEICNPKPAA